MNWRDKLNQFMYGRYGTDDFSKFILGVTLVLLLLNLFLHNGVISIIVLLLLVYAYYRMLSRNTSARYNENMKYLEYRGKVMPFFYKVRDKVTGFFGGNKARREDLKTHHIYRCPKCGQKIRVPRGKGKIVITCPKCGTEFTKKS